MRFFSKYCLLIFVALSFLTFFSFILTQNGSSANALACEGEIAASAPVNARVNEMMAGALMGGSENEMVAGALMGGSENEMVAGALVSSSEGEGASITLTYKNYSICYKDVPLRATNHLVKEEMHTRRINAPFLEKIHAVDTCIFAGADYKTALLYSFPLLEKTVSTAINKINTKPINSKISFYPDKQDMFQITREKNGAKTDENALYRNIYFALRRFKDVRIEVIPSVIQPDRTFEENSKLVNLRAKFSTYYGHSGESRKHNIELALKKINGSRLEGGAEFSFNKTAGSRNRKNGYKESIIINRGEYVEGVGGGVCQVSTTLYNCALLSDLKVTAVKNHSLEPSYVWPSFDAMVSSGTDLKFVNEGKYPVFIKAYSSDGNAIVEIYGSKLPYKILRRSEEISREEPPKDKILVDSDYKYFSKDDPVASGTQKRVWYSKGLLKSNGYLLYYDHNNRFLEKTHIRTDTYNRTNGLIVVAP